MKRTFVLLAVIAAVLAIPFTLFSLGRPRRRRGAAPVRGAGLPEAPVGNTKARMRIPKASLLLVFLLVGLAWVAMSLIQGRERTPVAEAAIGETVMGFVVDSVSEVIRLPEKNMEPAPAVIADKIGTEYVMGVGKLDNRLLILLNLDKILGAKELHSIQSISTDTAEAVA